MRSKKYVYHVRLYADNSKVMYMKTKNNFLGSPHNMFEWEMTIFATYYSTCNLKKSKY